MPAIDIESNILDEGVSEWTGNKLHRFMFKFPTLRNLAFTFPYMHNGAYFTLEQVVEHYSDIRGSLANYQVIEMLNTVYQKNYKQPREIMTENEEVLHRTSPKLSLMAPLLTSSQKEELVEFCGNLYRTLLGGPWTNG